MKKSLTIEDLLTETEHNLDGRAATRKQEIIIDLTKYSDLILTEELMDRIENLQNLGCEVEWPDHILRVVEDRLNDIDKRLKTLNPQGAMNVQDLLRQYITLKIGKRRITDIVSSVTKLLDIFEADLNEALEAKKKGITKITFLECVNDAAGFHTEACSGRTIFGFAVLHALLSIAQETDITKRLKAAQEIMVISAIEHTTNKFMIALERYEKNQGVHFSDAELCAVLLRETHLALLNNGIIDVAWDGMPTQIVKEEGVRDFLKRTIPDEGLLNYCFSCFKKPLFDETYDIALQAMQAPTSEIAKDLCGGQYAGFWAKLNLPDKVLEIETKYADAKENLVKLLGKTNIENDKTSELTYGEVRNFINDIEKKLPDLFVKIKDFVQQSQMQNPQNSANAMVEKNKGRDFLIHINEALETKKQSEIFKLSESLTVPKTHGLHPTALKPANTEAVSAYHG